tara:strand:+ start:368 stop:631 length:264 start_codon:yes stop_codon:yes gene_type:complete
MDTDQPDEQEQIEVGDIVTESELIIPPDRKSWVGIVVYVDKEHYALHAFLDTAEDMIGIHWFQPGYVEPLPASVVCLVQKAKDKKKT